MGASSADSNGKEKAIYIIRSAAPAPACIYWVGGFVFMGFAAGTVYQHHASLLLLATACARAAAEHAWDAVCLALAMAAIAMGLLGGQCPDHESSSSRNVPAFHEFMTQLLVGLPARQPYCTYVEDDDHGDSYCCYTVGDSNDVAVPIDEASADNSIKIANCNNNDFLQAADLHVDEAAPCAMTSSHEALSKETTSANTEVVKAQSRGSETARMPDEYAGEGEGKIVYGVLREIERAAGRANYSTQALQGGCTSGSDTINASIYDHVAEEEWGAEINRKADAFIASFREQMRREQQRELMLCS
ncbi:hypothetical protein GOP47_0023256 [Adiantum capillus-veneris]|uniref:Uncharacterized protein n=1 Tax=Adiantum capillus-veneris TaxID=13818 RepID=A0A9D4U7E3_ADICA|nr:hypothetical protein GOP47_0023256 [Adiantum capillus-veneris]